MRSAKISTVAALGTVALLALTGCSGGSSGGAPQDDVYEFQTNGIAPGDELTIQIPDDLREAAGADAEGLLVNAYRMTAHELDGAQYCAVDLAVEYADGATDQLAQESTSMVSKERFTPEEIEALIDDFRDDPVGTLRKVDSELAESLDEQQINYLHQQAEAGNDDKIREMLTTMTQDVEEVTPAEENLADELTGKDGGVLISELDPSAPEAGVYVSDDYSTITIVQDCAASPSDADATATVKFPVAEGDSFDEFASAEVAVMTDGVVSVVGGEVEDYMRDSSDNWIAD